MHIQTISIKAKNIHARGQQREQTNERVNESERKGEKNKRNVQEKRGGWG